jgi:hypothetical protein
MGALTDLFGVEIYKTENGYTGMVGLGWIVVGLVVVVYGLISLGRASR